MELPKLIFRNVLIVVSVLSFNVSYAIAANVDFKSIYNNDLESCNNIQTDKDYANSMDGVASIEESKNKQCESVKAEKDYVEPKFSTKRPRG